MRVSKWCTVHFCPEFPSYKVADDQEHPHEEEDRFCFFYMPLVSEGSNANSIVYSPEATTVPCRSIVFCDWIGCPLGIITMEFCPCSDYKVQVKEMVEALAWWYHAQRSLTSRSVISMVQFPITCTTAFTRRIAVTAAGCFELEKTCNREGLTALRKKLHHRITPRAMSDEDDLPCVCYSLVYHCQQAKLSVGIR